MIELKCFEIYDGETHWYAAETPYEALELHIEEFYIDKEDAKNVEITEFPLDNELVVRYDDDERFQTAGEWVEEIGKGLICSTAY